MGMDTVDIGGAAANGRPAMPPITTVDENGKTLYDESAYSNQGPPAAGEPESVSDAVRRATERTPIGGATPAYPENHPANRDDANLDADGVLVIAGRGSTKSDMYRPLGDVRKGYVTGPRVDGTEVQSTAQDKAAVMAELTQEVATLEAAARSTAHNELGRPLIEVLFHLDIGVVASYHSHVIEQDRWLIFVDDTNQPATQKFIPKPDGQSAEPINITVTGADKQPQQRSIRPLGINFTLGNLDIFVTMVVQPATEE